MEGSGDDFAEVLFIFVGGKGGFDCFLSVGEVIAEMEEGAHCVAYDTGGLRKSDSFGFRDELVAHFNDEPLGGFFADARDFAEESGVGSGDGALE